MLRKISMFVSSLLLGLLMLAAFPATNQAQQNVTGNFIFINYFGQELQLELDDTRYVVPGTATQSDGGRLTLTLALGQHKYAVTVPGIPLGSAGEFTLEAGQMVAKAARLAQTQPRVENGILIEKPRDYVQLFDFNPNASQPVAPIDTWKPIAAPTGQASVIWVNNGGVDELTLDVNGQTYKVPPKKEAMPGRLQLNFAPGYYKYTVSVPNGGGGGELKLDVGQVMAVSVAVERPAPVYDVGDDYNPFPEAKVTITLDNWTAKTITSTLVTSGTLTTTLVTRGTLTTTQPAMAITTTLAQTPSVLIKNYTADTLLLTVNGQVYPVPSNGEYTLNLPIGRYDYTASLPLTAKNGTLDLTAKSYIELSATLNLADKSLLIYQN